MIVLDTHAWIWWRAAPEKLSPAARGAIAGAAAIGLSTISVWELATLVRRGRLRLDREVAAWTRRAVRELELLAPDPATALLAGQLEADFPGDPADRLIYAAAVRAGGGIVTRDARIAGYDPARAIW